MPPLELLPLLLLLLLACSGHCTVLHYIIPAQGPRVGTCTVLAYCTILQYTMYLQAAGWALYCTALYTILQYTVYYTCKVFIPSLADDVAVVVLVPSLAGAPPSANPELVPFSVEALPCLLLPILELLPFLELLPSICCCCHPLLLLPPLAAAATPCCCHQPLLILALAAATPELLPLVASATPHHLPMTSPCSHYPLLMPSIVDANPRAAAIPCFTAEIPC
jgi:hypothetical protein